MHFVRIKIGMQCHLTSHAVHILVIAFTQNNILYFETSGIGYSVNCGGDNDIHVAIFWQICFNWRTVVSFRNNLPSRYA